MFLQILCILFLFPAIIVTMYYMILAIYALIFKKKKMSMMLNQKHTFAIVIPAHNEESVISNTLLSCAKLDYPKDKYKVIVIADNCSDRTSEIATKHEAVCLERFDNIHRGKGYALAWAFDRILPEGHDAVIVLDADCQIDTHALRVFDQHLTDGKKVLQANVASSNPDDTTMSYAVSVGNVIENDLFYAPKSQLGLAVFLRGTGMVFRQDVLLSHPWKAHSIVEDLEFSLNLMRNGVRVTYVGDVKVKTNFPPYKHQLNTQRIRWASGTLGFGKTQALKLIWGGVVKRSCLLVDAGWTFLVLSRPLVLLELFIAVILAIVCLQLWPGLLSKWLLRIGLVLILMQGLYFGIGIFFLGINLRRIKLLLGTPVLVIRLMVISLLGIIGVNIDNWVRTPR